MAETKRKRPKTELSTAVERGLKRAYKVARKTARMHGTPLVIMKDGKMVLEKP
jgi:hypothetical protein